MKHSNSELQAGDILGTVEVVDQPTKILNSSCAQVQTQHIINYDHGNAESNQHKTQLKQQLKLAGLQTNLSETGVSAEQLQQLENVLLDADDVFTHRLSPTQSILQIIHQ